MNETQIQNAINLCHGEPVSKIMRLFSLGMWRESQLKALAEHFGCNADRQEVALHLSIGH